MTLLVFDLIDHQGITLCIDATVEIFYDTDYEDPRDCRSAVRKFEHYDITKFRVTHADDTSGEETPPTQAELAFAFAYIEFKVQAHI